MKTTKSPEPTIAELNHAQAEWMALNLNAPDKEKQRVFKLMESRPKRYIALHENGGGILMLDGAPTAAAPLLISYCVSMGKKHGARVDVCWDVTKSEWVQTPLW